ncbi:hypothetical protein WR25_17930 [Diploscapter pachys]|uniref:Uncharacterized protein n=1 Tax=Diploscapter pachys TaxID=2018661 RepID=A0A2A2KEM9_9BILA|nr:hypothetical protein WR25_17930 [Diploscapter pachys]
MDAQNEKRKKRYWIDKKFREKHLKQLVTPGDPIYSLYLRVDMDKWRETRNFGRTVQSVKDRINEKVAWIDKVMSGEKEERTMCFIVWREAKFVYLLVVLPGYPSKDN